MSFQGLGSGVSGRDRGVVTGRNWQVVNGRASKVHCVRKERNLHACSLCSRSSTAAGEALLLAEARVAAYSRTVVEAVAGRRSRDTLASAARATAGNCRRPGRGRGRGRESEQACDTTTTARACREACGENKPKTHNEGSDVSFSLCFILIPVPGIEEVQAVVMGWLCIAR